MKKLLILTAAVMLASCGTNMREKITIVEPVDWKVETLSKAVITCTVGNSSCHKLRITEGRFRLHTGLGDVATVLLNEQVTIPRRAVTPLEIPIRIKLNDPLALLASPSGLMVSGEATVRVGPARKKIHVRNEPISEYIDKLAQ